MIKRLMLLDPPIFESKRGMRTYGEISGFGSEWVSYLIINPVQVLRVDRLFILPAPGIGRPQYSEAERDAWNGLHRVLKARRFDNFPMNDVRVPKGPQPHRYTDLREVTPMRENVADTDFVFTQKRYCVSDCFGAGDLYVWQLKT